MEPSIKTYNHRKDVNSFEKSHDHFKSLKQKHESDVDFIKRIEKYSQQLKDGTFKVDGKIINLIKITKELDNYKKQLNINKDLQNE